MSTLRSPELQDEPTELRRRKPRGPEPVDLKQISNDSDLGQDLRSLIDDDDAPLTPEQVRQKEEQEEKERYKKYKYLYWASWVLVGVFALACGVQTGGSLYLAGVLAPGAATYVGTLGLFACSAAMNFWICMNLPAKLIITIWEGKLFKYADGKTLSPIRIGAVILTLICAASAALVFGALTAKLTIPLLTSLPFLAAASSGFNAIAGIFGAGVVFCLSGLLVMTPHAMIQNRNFWSDLKNALFDLVDIDPDSVNNRGPKGERRWRPSIIAQKGLTLLFSLGSLALTIFGVVSTMLACTKGFNELLIKMFHAAPHVARDVSRVIGMGFAFAGQLPFYMRQAVILADNGISALFNLPNDPPKTFTDFVLRVGRFLLGFIPWAINGFGNGALARLGMSEHASMAAKNMALTGGTVASLAAGAGKSKRVAPSSTATSLNGLKYQAVRSDLREVNGNSEEVFPLLSARSPSDADSPNNAASPDAGPITRTGLSAALMGDSPASAAVSDSSSPSLSPESDPSLRLRRGVNLRLVGSSSAPSPQLPRYDEDQPHEEHDIPSPGHTP